MEKELTAEKAALIREQEQKAKDVITKKGLPLIFDTIKTISTAIVTAAAEGVANSIIKNGGQV